MNKLLSIIASVVLFGTAAANDSLVNKLCPDFTFDTLLNYKKGKLALADLKGKFVIIDFWGTFCVPCINDIPKIEQLQKQYGNTLQVLMVATDGWERAKQFYEARQKGNKPMYLPCAINRKFVDYFQVKVVSTYVWIDDKGYIKAITDDSQLTAQNIADFVGGKSIQLRQMGRNVSMDYRNNLAAIANEIDSNGVLYNSSFTKCLNGFTSGYVSLTRGRTKVWAINMSIMFLYRIAFGDTARAVTFNRTALESAHPEKLNCPKSEDFEVWKLDNTFCYELTVPKEKQTDILKIMQEELKRMFGYNVFQEYRTQKCLVLKAEKSPDFFAARELTPKLAMSTGGVTVKNHSFAELVELIEHYNQTKIVLDETGITGNIDVVLQAQMNDPDSLNEALKKYGLYLQWEDRQVKMLVIKDPQ